MFLDECFSPALRPRFLIFETSFVCTFLFSWICFKKNKRLFVHIHSGYAIFSLVTFSLKQALNDYTCNTVPNSVSGHGFFSFYYFLSHILYFFTEFPSPPKLYSTIFIISVSLNIAGLCNTYFGGYHTMRQVIYGIGVSIASVIIEAFLWFKGMSSLNTVFLPIITVHSLVAYEHKPSLPYFVIPAVVLFVANIVLMKKRINMA